MLECAPELLIKEIKETQLSSITSTIQPYKTHRILFYMAGVGMTIWGQLTDQLYYFTVINTKYFKQPSHVANSYLTLYRKFEH